MNNNYKCIIFDCDGVLVDSESISAKVFRDMLSELGCNLDFETILEQITGTSMKANLNYFAECLGKDLPCNFEKEFRARSYEAFKTDLKPIPGVHNLIDKIKVPIGVASSGPAAKIKLNLTTTGLIDKFGDHIFSCYDINSWKPEPDIYLHAAKQLGFSAKDCAVIEDSETGVISAIKGGFDVYALAAETQINTFTELGATVFFNMEELGNLLKID
jgi:HAD superfamily hydrolase (TIGR01509 family)